MLNDVSPPPLAPNRHRRRRTLHAEDSLGHATLYDHPIIPQVEPANFWLSLVLMAVAATMAIAVWMWTR
jgi:hypothetical protein